MANVGGDQVTQELSGVDLARVVAEAVGWRVYQSLGQGNINVQVGQDDYRTIEHRCGVDHKMFRPQSSADDALKALKVMNARGWRATGWRQPWRQNSQQEEVRLKRFRGPVLEVTGKGDTLAEALSRAIVAAHEAES